MTYIKLDENKELVITSLSPLYRGDNLSQSITFLVPLEVDEVNIDSSVIYMSYIRADGTADIMLLDKQRELYNDTHYQFTVPVTCTMTRYPGECIIFLVIYSGDPCTPIITKSGECVLKVLQSTDMDEFINDRNLSLIYQMHKSMLNKVADTEEALNKTIAQTSDTLSEAILITQNGVDMTRKALDVTRKRFAEELDKKADNIRFNRSTGRIQLTSRGRPVGDEIQLEFVGAMANVGIEDVLINDDGELVIIMDDGTVKNMGTVVGADGAVYVPHIDENKVLTFTIEDAAGEVPDPVDLNPNDEWSYDSGDSSDITLTSDFVWEEDD